MIYVVLADITVVIHLLWICFLVFGACWGRKDRIVMAVHLSGLGFAFLLQLAGWYCPLTHLEFWLRQRHDPALAYPGSFIARYAEQFVYIDLSPRLIFLLTLLVAVITALLYRRVLRRSSRRRDGSFGTAEDRRRS